MTGELNGAGQLTLMIRTSTGHTAGKDLRSLGNKAAKLRNIFVVDEFGLINTEAAHLATALAGTTAANFSFRSVSHGKYLLIKW